MGFGWLGHHIHDWAYALGHLVSDGWRDIVEWLSKAAMDGVFGLALGMVLIPSVKKLITPAWSKFAGKPEAH